MGHTWDDAKDLLAQALEQPPAEREAFVRKHGRNPDVIDDVLGLLREAGSSDGSSLLPSLPLPAEEPELAPGTRIGAYTIIDTIATGGMGRVYLARDLTLQRRVAIKSLRGPEAHGAAARSVIHQEASSAARITNPHVATIHGFFEENGRSYIVMEYVDGEALSQVLRRGKLAVSRVLEIGLQLAGGLAAAHAKGVIHRDLKPANIQLTADGTAKILDFGIASVKTTLTTRTAAAGRHDTIPALAGTPGYMSPEQWQRRNVDERSDIFSLGLVLFEMTTGRRALASEPLDARTPAVPRADSFDRKVPRALADAISRAVAVDPADRFVSANELREALERVQRQMATTWTQRLAGTGALVILRVLAGVLLLGCLCIALGYISSTTFNRALERTDFVAVTVWTCFKWGGMSVVVHALVALVLGAGIGLLVVLRIVLLPMSAGLQSWDRNVRAYFGKITRHSPGHAPLFASWIVLVLGAMLGLIWWTFWRYIGALLTHISEGSAEQLALLGPDHSTYRQLMEISLVVLTIAATGAAVWIAWSRAAPEAPTNRALMAASWAIALLAIISSQLSYQFNHEYTKMPLIKWNEQTCYVLGKSDSETLLGCPAKTPHLHRLSSSDDADMVPLKDAGHFYDGFAGR